MQQYALFDLSNKLEDNCFPYQHADKGPRLRLCSSATLKAREIEPLLPKSIRNRDVISHICALRGIRTAQQIDSFFKPSLTRDMPDPSHLLNLDTAKKMIGEAIANNRRIAIAADYDADGTCAAAILKLALKLIGAEARVFSPCRFREGYGLSPALVQKVHNSGCDMLICLDFATRNNLEIALARKLGIKTIVSDHHLISGYTPAPADVLINPSQADCGYCENTLCATGLAWVMAKELCGLENALELLPLAAIATLADVCTLNKFNRALVFEGMRQMQNCNLIGLRALLQASNIGAQITSADIAYGLAPRLNAPGRVCRYEEHNVSGAELVVELLTCSEPRRAFELAQLLNSYNRLRKEIESDTRRSLEQSLDLSNRILVFAQDALHEGVIGIVASRLVDRYRKTTAILSKNTAGIWKGSVRASKADNVVEMLLGCEDLLLKFGGHKAAGGLSLKEENLPEFTRRFNQMSQADESVSELDVDFELSLSACRDRGTSLLDDIAQLEPFGAGYPNPTFLAHNISILHTKVLEQGHLSLIVQEGGGTFASGIIWHGGYNRNLKPGQKVHLAYRPMQDRFEKFNTGSASIQLEVVAVGEV